MLDVAVVTVTAEGTNCVGTVGIVPTRVVETFILVFVAVAPCEAGGTVSAPEAGAQGVVALAQLHRREHCGPHLPSGQPRDNQPQHMYKSNTGHVMF